MFICKMEGTDDKVKLTCVVVKYLLSFYKNESATVVCLLS